MRILTTLAIVLHIIIAHNIALCNLHTHNLQSYTKNKHIFQKNLNQQTIQSYTHHHDYITNTLNLNTNYIPNKQNIYMHHHDISPIIFTNFSSKVQIQNDSINIFHSFCKKHSNIHQKTLSFVQLGIRDILSEQIVNFGIGKRYTPNNISMIGCHTFYNCPIVKNNYYTNNKQTHSINLSVEYWIHNMLFMLNNYYNLSNIISSTQESYKYNIYNPKNSYQIYIQTKFPYFSEFTGKIKLEQFFYNKKYQKIFKKTHNYCLSLCLNYQPIPILGVDINNVFIHKKCNTTCKILINYQFGVPLAQQINNINKQNKPTSYYLDTIIQPFTPTVIQYHDDIVYNQYDDIYHIKSLQNIQEITGYPGEIKIIETNKNYQSKKWDFQQLQKKGGYISTISDNTYAVILPNNPITKENEIYISHNSNTTQNPIEQKPKKINILVKDILEKQISNTQLHNSQIIHNDVNAEINITDNTIQSISIPNTEEYNDEINNVSNSNIATTPQYHIRDDAIKTKLINNVTTTKKDDDATILLSPPPPPPIPTNFLKMDKPSVTTQEQLIQSSSSLLSCSTPYKDDTSTNTNDNFKEEKIDDISIIQHYHMQSNNQNDDLSYRLAQHKKFKFSSIGTQEYINKLESTITERKKSKHFSSDMEKILIKLNIASSSSSINEDCITDNSEDNFSDTNHNYE